MLQNYKNLIQDLFNNVFHNGNTNISFEQYLSIIGMSLLLMLALIAFIVLIIGTIYLPFFVYRKYTTKEVNLLNELTNKLSTEKLSNERDNIRNQIYNTEKKKTKKSFIYVLVLIVFYLPIVIPTVLYIFTAIKNIL